jgi:UDP-N-acetylmuramoyl-L-alanyl-D-glutamate--2,6-diaminopimelate ligase
MSPGLAATLAGVHRLTVDSRRVRPGDAFLAYPGERADGRRHIGDAIAAGAGAVLWEPRGFDWNAAWHVPNQAVENLRAQAGEIAAEVYGAPSRALWMVGVTGTNGKTSCAHWLARLFTRAGKKCAVLGTLGNGFPDALTPALNTTPDAVEAQALLADYRAQGASAAVMEVSSHGLDQGRVNGMHFDVALFTNLSRDHLDYHGDMARYGAAKARLLRWPGLRHAVLNLDDAFGAELAQGLGCGGVQTVGYGFGESAVSTAVRIQGRRFVADADGLRFEVATPWGRADVVSPLVGRFNASNLLAVLAVLLVSGVPLEAAVAELATLAAPAGRMQRLGGAGAPWVVVDYAHTPDALEKTLAALRELVPAGGRLFCVFGCGGGRDQGKRALMGEVAARLADEIIVSDDNPRHEASAAIIADIEAGLAGRPHRVIAARGDAIRRAVLEACQQDIVLIAGKGHEDYQEIAGVRHPFSDVAEARAALAERKERR